MHLFIGELGKNFDSGTINVITENKKKYISFSMSIVVDELEIPRSKEMIVRGTKLIVEGRRKIAMGKKLTEGSEGKQKMITKEKEILTEGKRILAERECIR